jgi:hypothetical protein
MWRLLLSGLFCVPALLILLVQRHDNAVPGSRATLVPPASVATSNAVAPAIRLSLPPVQFSTEPALPDPGSWDIAGPAVSIPLREVTSQASIVDPIEPSTPSVAHRNVAMRRHPRAGSSHRAVEVAAVKPESHAEDHSILVAFLVRNLTRYSIAPPDPNGGG